MQIIETGKGKAVRTFFENHRIWATILAISGLFGGCGVMTFLPVTPTHFVFAYCMMFAGMLLGWFAWPEKKGFLLILTIGVLLRAVLLFSSPNDDIYRYIWEGYIQNAGFNPFHHAPSAPILSHIRIPVWEGINHKDIATIYGPFAQLLFRAGAAISLSPLFFKFLFVLFDIGTLFVLHRFIKTSSYSIRHLILYAWNPLVVFSIAGEGHMESIVVFWLTLTALFAYRKRYGSMFFALGLATVVKATPLFLFPLLLYKKNGIYSLLFFIPLLSYFLYYDPAISFISVPSRFITQFHFNGFLYNPFSLLFSSKLSSFLCWYIFFTCIGFIFFIIPDPVRAIYYGLIAFLLCSPTLHPWYLLLLTPFLVLYRNPSLLALHASIALAYTVSIRFHQSGIWKESFLVWGAEYIPFMLIALWYFFRGIQHGTTRFSPPSSISVIIPTYQEQENIGGCIDSINAPPDVDTEIIVVDGGSEDGTREVVVHKGVSLLTSNPGRGIQIAHGIKSARGDIIIIVHADSRLLPQTLSTMVRSLARNPQAVGGAFFAKYRNSSPRFRFTEFLNNIRVLFFGISFGDQAQFFRREVLQNEYPDYMLMEDVELAFRMKEKGASLFLPYGVNNSVRMWQKKGYTENMLKVIGLTGFFIILRRFGLIRNKCAKFYSVYYGLAQKW